MKKSFLNIKLFFKIILENIFNQITIDIYDDQFRDIGSMSKMADILI